MRKFGLIGYPLGHSFSKKYFTEKYERENIDNCIYNNYPLENIDDFKKLVSEEEELVGLNVTIPYKEQVIKYLDDLDDNAREIGAVNTIKISRQRKSFSLKGYNTDAYGFEQPLKDVITQNQKKALVLGTGGASKAVAWVLKSMNIEYKFVSRNPKSTDVLSYGQLNEELIHQFKIIVNTSPIGMHPKEHLAPDIPYGGIGSQHILYDLIYNPEETKFLSFGKDKNAIVINGLPMLYFQAEKAWEIWNSGQ